MRAARMLTLSIFIASVSTVPAANRIVTLAKMLEKTSALLKTFFAGSFSIVIFIADEAACTDRFLLLSLTGSTRLMYFASTPSSAAK